MIYCEQWNCPHYQDEVCTKEDIDLVLAPHGWLKCNTRYGEGFLNEKKEEWKLSEQE